MKRIILMLIIGSCITHIYVFPQEQPKSSDIAYLKNQIGIQFNPYIDDLLFQPGIPYIITISALRYGYRITKNVTSGMEFSYIFPINVNLKHQYFHHDNIGLLTRYSILSDKRFQIFAEASPYYSHIKVKYMDASDTTINRFGIYIAPGVSLFSRNKKFSLDLYYKFSNLTFVNGKKSVFSYKVNFNF
jgi:hypothetical protein